MKKLKIKLNSLRYDSISMQNTIEFFNIKGFCVQQKEFCNLCSIHSNH